MHLNFNLSNKNLINLYKSIHCYAQFKGNKSFYTSQMTREMNRGAIKFSTTSVVSPKIDEPKFETKEEKGSNIFIFNRKTRTQAQRRKIPEVTRGS